MPEREWIGKLCQLTHASSLQQICDLAYEIMGNPVFISDMAHTILAYTKCVEVDDESWQRHIVRADLERNTIIQSREVSTVHEASAETKMPVVVTDGQVPYPRLIKALVSEGQPVGVMVLTAYLRPLEQEDIQLMELTSSFAETRLNRDRYHVTTDGNAVENYFIQLLEGAQYSREQVDKRLNVLGFSLRECAYVLCICPAQATERAGESLRPMLEEFKRLPFSRTFLYNSALVCVYSCGQDISNWETQAPKLTELLRRIAADGHRSVLFSTHITSDLEKCASHITFIKDGTIQHTGTLADFRQHYDYLRQPGQELTLEDIIVSVERRPLDENAIV